MISDQPPFKSQITICKLDQNLLNSPQTDIDAKLQHYNAQERKHIIVDRSKGRVFDSRIGDFQQQVGKDLLNSKYKPLIDNQDYVYEKIDDDSLERSFSKGDKRRSIWQDNWKQIDKAHQQFLQTIIKNQAFQFLAMLANSQQSQPIDINYKYQSNWTPIHYAAMNSAIQIISRLINDPRIDLNATTSFGQSALHIASKANKTDNCLLLIGAGVQVNRKDQDGNTALHYAAELGYKQIVQLLLQSKADSRIKNSSGMIPGDLASVQLGKLLPKTVEVQDSLYGNRPNHRTIIQRMLQPREKQVQVVNVPTVPKQKKQSRRMQNLFKLYKFISTVHPAQTISLSSFRFYKKIGQGAFGEVYIVRKQQGEKMYALKAIQKQRVINSNLYRYIQTQKQILSLISHPFIVKLRYAFQTEAYLFLVMDYCEGGDLSKLLQKKRRFDEIQVKKYAAEILLGIQALHKNNIIYRDMKPENIVLDKDGHVLLTDFGLSKKTQNLDDLNKSFCGTPAYLPLQIINKKGHTRMADWYQYGVVLYELYTGFPPFYADTKAQLYQLVRKGYIRFSKNTPQIFKDLIKRLLAQSPQKRLGYQKDAESIRQHPWFADVDWQLVYNRGLQMTPIDNKLKIGEPIKTKFNDNKSDKSQMPLWSFME